ncbi:MAG: RtcB family protein [Fimbriimonadales bacterium]|nr:RtcB family protein [Fimbriimonadales bacterium]
MSQAWKGPLEQIDEYRWRIPKSYKPGMRVDGLIFASKEMIEHIKQDQAPEQVANVAFLPGIVGYSIAMPDIHWGYGFPVGGVAAMDLEEGVISPGGIGYDINCLAPDTRVLTEHGYFVAIGALGEVWLRERVACFHLAEGNRTSAPVDALLQVRPNNPVYRLRTLAGYEVVATSEHPFWTPAGMRPLKALRKGDRVAVYPFEGVAYEPPSSETLVSREAVETYLRGIGKSGRAARQIVRTLERRGLLPLRMDSPQLPYLTRLLGYLTGKGTLRYADGSSKGVAVFYGEPNDLERIRADVEQLGFRPSATRGNAFTVSSSAFVALLACLDAPLSGGVQQAHRVPAWLRRAPRWLQRLYLSGLFSAALSAPCVAKNRPATFRAPTLSLHEAKPVAESSWVFLRDIQQLLREFGIHTRLLRCQRKAGNISPPGQRFAYCRLQVLNDDANLIRLWSQIGYDYAQAHHRQACLAVAYLRLKQQATARLHTEHSLEEGKGARFCLPKDFPTFAEFCAEALASTDGMVWDVIRSVEIVAYTEPFVYDLTVRKQHNFIANGFVVSNCGVRLLRTDLTEKQVRPRLKELVDQIFRDVPAGFGGEGLIRVNRHELRQVMVKGAHWMVEHGYGWEDDLAHTEANGRLEMADPDVITEKAIERGKDQLGTLGGGNHFLEIQVVDEIYDPKAAAAMGITQVGQVTVMIHTGSRGFGHQTCQDHLDIMEVAHKKYGITLPDRQLACAPIKSEEGQTYLRAMHCAANFAFANRQAIAHWVRQAFARIFKSTPESLGMYQVYDVAHNIAKIEEHEWEGKKIRVCVHRKGATRAFPPGHPETPAAYREIGQPVLIPGDMGRYSFVLVGTEGAMRESFGTTCHGAGRMMSRKGALREARKRDIAKELEQQGIIVRAQNKATLGEEASYAYKDVADVVEVVHNAGIARKVARLRPIGVVKG